MKVNGNASKRHILPFLIIVQDVNYKSHSNANEQFKLLVFVINHTCAQKYCPRKQIRQHFFNTLKL